MPLKRCVNAEGKKGWSWGNGGCQVAGSDEESKKQAIRVGIKVEGPEKFSKIMKSKASELNTSDLMYIKQLMTEASKKNIPDFLTSVAKQFYYMNFVEAKMSAQTRKEIPDDEFAGPNRTFPIRNQMDVEHAAMLLHHAADPSAVKRNIIRLAHQKKLDLPHSWGNHSDEEK